jgi:hypothetical protein
MFKDFLPYLGLPITDPKIQNLFDIYSIKFPKKTTVTANNSNLGNFKIKTLDVDLQFHLGGNSKYLEFVPTKKKNIYSAQLVGFDFGPNYSAEMPFELQINASENELTQKLGEPTITNFMGIKTTKWKKIFDKKYEFVVWKNQELEKITNQYRIQFIWENDI